METYYCASPGNNGTTDDESYIGVLSAANNNNGLDENKNEVGDEDEEVTTNEDQLRWKKIYNELDTFEAQLQNELQDLETAHGIPVDETSMKATTKSNRGYRSNKQKRKDRRGRSNKQHQNSNSSLKYLPSSYTVSSKFSKGNGKSGKKLIKLTHKTSELKDDYQRYLASLNLSHKSNDMYNEEEKEAANVYDHVPSSPNNVLPTSTNQQQHQLQREWSYYNQEENAPINPAGYNNMRSSSGGEDVWYDTNNNRYDMSNTNNNGGYKRFLLKRGIIIAVAIVVGVICVGTIGIKQTLVSESAEETATNDNEHLLQETTATAKSFEDVEKELMEEMNEATIEKEEEMLQQAFHDVLKQNFMNKLPEVESEKEEMIEKQDGTEVESGTKGKLTAQLVIGKGTEAKPEEVTVYALAVERFQPKIYNRNNGWEGVTYQQALIFCSMQGMAICPYDAICPDGVKGEPLGGYREAPNGDWAWLPIIDDFDEYIQGGARERCVRYTHKYDGETPEWDGSFGLDSTDAKLTENLMCCANVM